MAPLYLDYQASTPMLPAVKDAMIAVLRDDYFNPHAETHLHGRWANVIVENALSNIAALLECEPYDIVFTSGATEANNFAIKCGARLNSRRRTILISAIEHKCVFEAAHALEKDGYIVKTISVDNHGYVCIDEFDKLLTDDVAIVSIMAANNEVGTIQNLSPLVKKAHKVGALFHTDAAQYLTHGGIDLSNWDIDFLSLSAHKMYGPIGIGALYISPHLNGEIEPFLHGGAQQDGRRAGTLSPLLCEGFGTAAALFKKNGDEIRKQTKRFRDLFAQRIESGLSTKLTLNGPPMEERHRGNLNIAFTPPSDELLLKLSKTVSASNGSACSTGSYSGSHVLRAIGAKHLENTSLRFGFGALLSENEVKTAAAQVLSTLQSGLVPVCKLALN